MITKRIYENLCEYLKEKEKGEGVPLTGFAVIGSSLNQGGPFLAHQKLLQTQKYGNVSSDIQQNGNQLPSPQFIQRSLVQ